MARGVPQDGDEVMTPHVAEARRAAVHILWAACPGATLEEASEMMKAASALWPDKPLLVGKGGPLADTPSAEAWRRAAVALDAAKVSHGLCLRIDWDQRQEAERVAGEFIESRERMP